MFLLDRFREFYQEVIRQKGLVSGGDWVFTGLEGRIDDDAGPSPTAVWRTLHSLLERQALEAARSGGDFAAEVYRRAQYAMAALADETFLHCDWAGREVWRSHLLESRLFGSHTAGNDLFDRIDGLLRDRDDAHAELGKVYLLVLALGFHGKYRGRPEGEREIEAYRRRLFRFVAGHEPGLLAGSERLVPQAYEVTLDEGRASELPHLRPWLWAFALVIVAWLGASQVLWRYETEGLRPLIREIVDLGTRLSQSESEAGSR